MSTQFYNNRQDGTTFDLTTADVEVDVLATAANLPTYREGMAVNGGGVLHLEVDASTVVGDVALKGYRRLTNTAPWSPFYTGTVTGGTVFSDRIPDLYGYADVRITAEGAGGGTQTIVVYGTIFPL